MAVLVIGAVLMLAGLIAVSTVMAAVAALAGAVLWIVLLPFRLVGLGLALIAPLLPLLALVALVWWLVRGTQHPAPST